MKRTSLLAVPLLVVGLLAGCGGASSSGAAGAGGSSASDSPTSSRSAPAGSTADVAQFCTTFLNLLQSAAQQQGISDKQAVKLVKDLATKLEDLGTPATMPDDAKRALQTAIDKINALPDDATKEDMSKSAGDLTAAEKQDQQALSDWLTQVCVPIASGASSPSASTSPSPSS